MELIGITVGLIVLGLLAMRYGADSRELDDRMAAFGVQLDDECKRLSGVLASGVIANRHTVGQFGLPVHHAVTQHTAVNRSESWN